VLTDLLWHRIPAVVIYRDPGGWKKHVVNRLLTTGLFASTNLIAGRKVLPEYCFGEEGPLEQVGLDLQTLDRCGPERDRCIEELDRVCERLGPKGAAPRAAAAILSTLADHIQEHGIRPCVSSGFQ
jgi:lipid A disaccharide synthetase